MHLPECFWSDPCEPLNGALAGLVSHETMLIGGELSNPPICTFCAATCICDRLMLAEVRVEREERPLNVRAVALARQDAYTEGLEVARTAVEGMPHASECAVVRAVVPGVVVPCTCYVSRASAAVNGAKKEVGHE